MEKPAPAPAPAPAPVAPQSGPVVVINAPQDDQPNIDKITDTLIKSVETPVQIQPQAPIQALPETESVDCSKYDGVNSLPTNVIDRIKCDINKVILAAKSFIT